MRRVVIVQARTTSTRLPGKVLADLGGRPMLAQQLRRLRRCRQADEIVVATTRNATDDPVVALAEREGVRWYRGSEEDVLGRYAAAAAESRADVVVRVTADCPLLDPEVTDRVIAELSGHPQECDYASNVLPRTWPRGLDTEAMFGDVLVRVERLARSAAAREHVTFLVAVERPELFCRRNVADAEDHSDLRWTVDTAEDLTAVRAIYQGLGLSDRWLPYPEVLAWVRAHPEVASQNAHVPQRTA